MLEIILEYLMYGIMINVIMFIVLFIVTLQYSFTKDALFKVYKVKNLMDEYKNKVPLSKRILHSLFDLIPYYFGYKCFVILLKLNNKTFGDIIIEEYEKRLKDIK